jgi:hypothetical protein
MNLKFVLETVGDAFRDAIHFYHIFRCFLIKKLVKICVFRISFREVVKDDT